MSIYPDQLDTDLEIPRVDNNVTEVGADSINALRDAVFAIEKSLGLSIQGNKPDLATRLNVSIDSNGNLKTSALTAAGLVTLPIDDAQIGVDAAIQESKLDLNFSTQSLRNATVSLQTDTAALQSSFNTLSASFSGHTTGLSSRHDGYHININTGTFIGVAGLSATTIGDAVNEFSTLFIIGDGIRPPHVNFGLPISIKHTADFISVDSSNFTTVDPTSETVQDALDSIDGEIVGQQVEHMDNFHSNGILKEINSGEFFNPNQRKVGPVTVSYTVGTTVAAISGVTSFSDLKIVKGDILEIESGVDDTGTFRIQAIGPRTGTETLGDLPELAADEIDIFHVFAATSAAATGSIYKAASVSSESAPLACSVRNNNTLVDTVTILNPNAARVVSIGFDGTILKNGTTLGDGYDINVEVGLDNSMVRWLKIPFLQYERLGAAPPDVVDSQSVAERINAYVSHPALGFHFPISAFSVGNELAIAHNLVGAQYTLKILDGYTGNHPLGLDAYGADILDLTVAGNTSNIFNVNGTSRSTLRTLVNGYATITSNSTTFAIFNDDLSSVNPTSLGIRAGSVLHITGHPTLDVNGSYTLSGASSTDITTYETIPVVGASTTFDVLITDSHVSLNQLFSAESDLGLVEIFVDEDGRSLVNQRLTHDNSIAAISVIGVSDGFAPGTVILNQGVGVGNLRTFNIISNSVPGVIVTVDKNFLGTFKLYDPDNINYIIVRVNSEITGVATANVTVDNTLNLDETMRLCTLHFDSADSITNVLDTRNFGNISANQISDDFIELFSQRPISDLRSNGVVRGFDVIDLPYTDGYTGMMALPLNGGTAYINGVRVVVETQKVKVLSYDTSGNYISGTTIVGINDFGTIRTFDDELHEILSDGYVSSTEFGRILPLYRITLDSVGIISDVVDLRLFINNLDDKIDLIVDESNNVVGSFRSLSGALLYAGNYPGSEKLTIKIINTVEPDRALVVPDGVSIIGGAPYGGDKHKIVNTLDLNDHFITLSGNNRLENVEVASETISMDGYLVAVSGSNVNVEKCLLRFSDPVSILSFTNGKDYGVGFLAGAANNVRIVNNRIDKVFAGIVSPVGCDNLTITDNVLTNVVGLGIETHGIFVGSLRFASNVDVSRNTIEVPSVANSDIMGIKIGITHTINTVRLDHNIIEHDGSDTMTSGIHVENITAGTDKVSDLFVTHNKIRGIELDANSIFGIYVNDVERAIITNNILRDIGSTAGADTAFIKVDADVDSHETHSNILEDGNVLSGIDVGTSSNASVIGNTINNVGDTDTGIASTSTVFIRGNSPGAMVSNNTLIAAATETSPFGIYWSGAGSQTQISNNKLKANVPGDKSFISYGIRVLGTDMDISENTINDMNESGCIGIGSGAGGNRSKIIGNTISGKFMNALIEALGGSEFSISNNMLKNTENNSTIFIRVNSVTNSLIMGNSMRGISSSGINDEGTTITGITVANNKITATTNLAVNFGANSFDCFVAGNSFADNDSSVIGPTATNSTINRNLIGINRGLVDTVGISFAEGISSSSDGYDHWDIPDVADYWRASDVDGNKVLRFSLNKIPNGAKLESIDITGWRSDDTLTAQAFRKSVKDSGLGANQISSLESINTAGFFYGAMERMSFTTTDNVNVVNYDESNYFITIISTGGTLTSTIHGLKLNFRY